MSKWLVPNQIKFVALLISALLLISGCQTAQHSNSINGEQLTKDWHFGEKYRVVTDQEVGQGRVLALNGHEIKSQQPLKLSAKTKALEIDLGNFTPANVTFFFIDQVLLTADQIADTQGSSTIPLHKKQLTSGQHQLNIMQFKNDRHQGAVRLNRIVKYIVE
ncbi:hypothetical protein [Lapidilactobacillus bayanensis]|uniref:hypothetical protein n=1 Tax=Lapidilactobacillus bayanensis TaxID=2485998 RepID=UPI000F799EC3|nr:hypothetical protein [Lapidilactobacillus bayanensis]